MAPPPLPLYLSPLCIGVSLSVWRTSPPSPFLDERIPLAPAGLPPPVAVLPPSLFSSLLCLPSVCVCEAGRGRARTPPLPFASCGVVSVCRDDRQADREQGQNRKAGEKARGANCQATRETT